ncbi:RnfH family protein [Pseudogulbenkiania sp. MAI-1]|uniref:RnfH family protein n=1 Tax=Pseudogulbenkiania sp. MAI-1 TaxID=990370 RepID=UPI0004AD9A6C|nr:RnfH family protein [Pseudogulbenkiania sp. MAI-1]
MTNPIEIEVAYARPERQLIAKLTVEPGTTARQAVELSRIAEQFPEIDLANLQLGVFGKAVKPDAVLREHDRVEIYRPLIADPKEVRRRRAEAGKAMKKGGGQG